MKLSEKQLPGSPEKPIFSSETTLETCNTVAADLASILSGYRIKMTHPSESRTLKRLTAVLVGAVVIAALYLARDVLIPFALALLFAFLLNPLVAWIERKGLWRVPSVFLVMTLFLSAVRGTAWIVGNQLIAVVNKLPEYRSNLHQKIEILRNRRHAGLGKTADTVKQLDNELPSASSELGTSRSQAENRGASRATPAPVPVVVEPPSGGLSEAERLFGAQEVVAVHGWRWPACADCIGGGGTYLLQRAARRLDEDPDFQT